MAKLNENQVEQITNTFNAIKAQVLDMYVSVHNTHSNLRIFLLESTTDNSIPDILSNYRDEFDTIASDWNTLLEKVEKCIKIAEEEND